MKRAPLPVQRSSFIVPAENLQRRPNRDRLQAMLPRLTLGLFAFAGWISYSAPQPPDANVSTDDVHRFVDALHQIAPTDSTCAPFDDYLRRGTDGLKAYASKFG